MEGPKLESTMLDFIEGGFDILVSTTIIESGLDIPNANTIIINRANMFGLSDLHQMRGRVGRSNKQAFCLLISPPMSTLTPEARKRLQAIEQFSDLGSGFNIAMRDLDIRGAGDLLGAEQSGFISDIGFEMYQKILSEAIEELQEESFKDLYDQEHAKVFVKDCSIETDLEILLPTQYVDNISERLTLYKELDGIEDETKLAVFVKNLEDRFGVLPQPALDLIDTLRLRWMAKQVGFEKVVLKQGKFVGYFIADQQSAYYQSAQFTFVLSCVQKRIGGGQMKERNDKLLMVFEGVNTIPETLALLQPMLAPEENKAS